MKLSQILLLSLCLTGCLQMEKDQGTLSKGVVKPKENTNLIFSTNHEPINSLDYKSVRVESTDITSIKMFGSSEKNFSIIDDGSSSFKHLIHPSDQFLKAIIIKNDGRTYSLIFRLDIEEIVI